MAKFFGTGVLHTKFIIADDSSFYLGSANMDWRALTDVKELGLYFKNCTGLTSDLRRIFEVKKKINVFLFSIKNLSLYFLNNVIFYKMLIKTLVPPSCVFPNITYIITVRLYSLRFIW